MRPRNDRDFCKECGGAGRGGGPYGEHQELRGRDDMGSELSAASGGRSELISRKCPDWRPQQWPGIGWHDGGQPPAPTEGLQGVRYRKESPSHGFAVTPPLGKGAEGTGVTDCHTSDIGHWFAMTGGLYMGCGARQAGDREGRPYESVTRGAVQKRIPQSRLRRDSPFRQGGQGDGGCGLPHQ